MTHAPLSPTQVSACAVTAAKDPLGFAIQYFNSRLSCPTEAEPERLGGRFYNLMGAPVRLSKADTRKLQQLLLDAGWASVQVVVHQDTTSVQLDSGSTRYWGCIHDGQYLEDEPQAAPTV